MVPDIVEYGETLPRSHVASNSFFRSFLAGTSPTSRRLMPNKGGLDVFENFLLEEKTPFRCLGGLHATQKKTPTAQRNIELHQATVPPCTPPKETHPAPS